MSNFLTASPAFPVVQWKRETATFVAASVLPDAGDVPAPAALVFPFYGDRVVLGNIESRGWCIPSGHIEDGETPGEAVRREAWEEAGVGLSRVECIGYFVLTETDGAVRHAPTFIANVASFGGVPPGSESLGMQMVNAEDVADLYFSWDALLADVFAYAYAEKSHRLPVGVSLADLTATGQG